MSSIKLVLLNKFNLFNISIFILDIPKRKDEDEEEQEEENDIKTENISDEGIEDSDSDSRTSPNDYLISSVSKTDLDLMSMLFYL